MYKSFSIFIFGFSILMIISSFQVVGVVHSEYFLESSNDNFSSHENFNKFSLSTMQNFPSPNNSELIITSNLLGGSSDDEIRDIVTDSNGNIIVVGFTFSPDFPVLNANQSTKSSGIDAFVAKFDSSWTLLWSTFLGGTGVDEAYAVNVDDLNNIYVTGWTTSSDFLIVNGYNNTYSGDIYGDVFLAKFSSDGQTILWSTYLGGYASFNRDIGHDIAIDGNNNVILVGQTVDEFETLNGYMNTAPTSFATNGFVSKFGSNGTLLWSTYLAGTSPDLVLGATIDSQNNILVTGETNSGDFPLINAFNSTHQNYDTFITKFLPNGSITWSTLIGGGNSDQGNKIVVGNQDNIYIAGNTRSSDFPTLNGINETHTGVGTDDAFVLKFASDGQSLIWSTFIGGINSEFGFDLAFDSAKTSLTVAGITQSNFNNTFPLINSFSTESDTSHAFFASFTPTGSLLQSSHIGGNANDIIRGVEIDSNSNILLAGQTFSTNFPLTSSQQLNGTSDGFITKLVPGSFANSPNSLILNPDHGEILLEWQAPTQLGNLPFTEYRIYRATSINGSYSVVGTSSTLSYLDNSVSNGETYWYAVVLVNTAGEGEYSTKAMTSLLFASSPPINITSQGNDAQVVLSWDLPLNDGYSPLTWFNVYRSSTSSGSFIFQGSVTSTSFADTNVVNGETYYYVVTAMNDIGESNNSAEAQGIPQKVGGTTKTIDNFFTTTDTETVTTGSEILVIYGILAISVLIYKGKNHKRK